MSSNAERVEIYSGIQRRRRYSVDEKLRILQEASRPGITISYVARQHGISPSLLFHWRRRMAEGGKEAIRVDEEVVGSSASRRRNTVYGVEYPNKSQHALHSKT